MEGEASLLARGILAPTVELSELTFLESISSKDEKNSCLNSRGGTLPDPRQRPSPGEAPLPQEKQL